MCATSQVISFCFTLLQIDALSDMQQSSDVQAVETTGELDAEAVEVTKIVVPHKNVVQW